MDYIKLSFFNHEKHKKTIDDLKDKFSTESNILSCISLLKEKENIDYLLSFEQNHIGELYFCIREYKNNIPGLLSEKIIMNSNYIRKIKKKELLLKEIAQLEYPHKDIAEEFKLINHFSNIILTANFLSDIKIYYHIDNSNDAILTNDLAVIFLNSENNYPTFERYIMKEINHNNYYDLLAGLNDYNLNPQQEKLIKILLSY